MIRPSHFALMLLLLLVSCTDHKTSVRKVTSHNLVKKEQSFTKENLLIVPDSITGIYEGNFGSDFIHVVLTYVNDHKVVGYNIHKGLIRNIMGNCTVKDSRLEFALEEPGDNEYDGLFDLQYDEKKRQLTGTWKSKSGAISPKTLVLKRQMDVFKNYDEKQIYIPHEPNTKDLLEEFGTCSGIAGDITFERDGLVIFNNYPNNAIRNHTEQKVEIKGSWRFIRDKVQVSWQDNDFFEKNNHVFTIQNIPDSIGPFIDLENHVFTPDYY